MGYVKQKLPAIKLSSVHGSDCISKPHVFNEDVRFFYIVEALVCIDNTRRRVYQMAERPLYSNRGDVRPTDKRVAAGYRQRGYFSF